MRGPDAARSRRFAASRIAAGIRRRCALWRRMRGLPRSCRVGNLADRRHAAEGSCEHLQPVSQRTCMQDIADRLQARRQQRRVAGRPNERIGSNSGLRDTQQAVVRHDGAAEGDRRCPAEHLTGAADTKGVTDIVGGHLPFPEAHDRDCGVCLRRVEVNRLARPQQRRSLFPCSLAAFRVSSDKHDEGFTRQHEPALRPRIGATGTRHNSRHHRGGGRASAWPTAGRSSTSGIRCTRSAGGAPSGCWRRRRR